MSQPSMTLTNKVRTCAINVMSFDDSNFQQLIYGIICNLISAFYFRSLSICLGDLEPAIIGFVFGFAFFLPFPVSFMLYIINILCTNVFCLLRKSNRGKVSLGICNASARGAGERSQGKSRRRAWSREGRQFGEKEIHPTPRHNNKHGPESNNKPLLGLISCVTGLRNYGKGA